MPTCTKRVLFIDKNNTVTLRFLSSDGEDDNKLFRSFIAVTNGYGYAFIVTKLKSNKDD